jgi:hypothetical protein
VKFAALGGKPAQLMFPRCAPHQQDVSSGLSANLKDYPANVDPHKIGGPLFEYVKGRQVQAVSFSLGGGVLIDWSITGAPVCPSQLPVRAPACSFIGTPGSCGHAFAFMCHYGSGPACTVCRTTASMQKLRPHRGRECR